MKSEDQAANRANTSATQQMSEVERATFLSFVDRSFRDMADMDYIAARVLHRLGLLPPFLGAANQAVEKYLKAILLYNDVPAKGLGHDLEKGLTRLGNIPNIDVEIPDDVRRFIKVLNDEGGNRYFEFPMEISGDELLELDRSVWHLRRCAQRLKSQTGVAWRLPPFKQEDVHRFRVRGGYLEKVLATRGVEREQLVWKNFYYGSRKKRVISLQRRVEVANPTHSLNPSIFPLLSRMVDFSKETKAWFKQHGLGASRPPT